MALLVSRHLGRKGAYRVVGRVLGDVEIEVLRAPLRGERDGERLAGALRRLGPGRLRSQVVPGVFPLGERREIALGGADGEGLVLLLLLAADALELVGDVVVADVPHVALELDEALECIALDGERVRIEFDQVLRQQSLAHGRWRM